MLKKARIKHKKALKDFSRAVIADAQSAEGNLREVFNEAATFKDKAERYLVYQDIEDKIAQVKKDFSVKFHDYIKTEKVNIEVTNTLTLIPAIVGGFPTAIGGFVSFLGLAFHGYVPVEGVFCTLGGLSIFSPAVYYEQKGFMKEENIKEYDGVWPKELESVFTPLLQEISEEKDLLPEQDPQAFAASPHFNTVLDAAPELKERFERAALQKKFVNASNDVSRMSFVKTGKCQP